MDDYGNLKFASLFHDIGKFYQRTNKCNNTHFELSAAFVKDKLMI